MGEPRATLKTGYGAALLALAMVGFFGWLLAGQSGSATLSVFADTDTLMVVVAAGAAFTTAVSARLTRGRVRGAWLSLTVGLAGFTLGAAIWLYYAVAGRMAPFPSVADAAYLMLPIAAGVALLLLSTGLSRTSRTRLILDGMCVAASFSIIVWAAVLNEVWEASARDQLKIAVSLAYPVLDAAVLTIAVVVLARAQPSQRRTLGLLTLAMVCIAVSDGVFVYLAATQRHVNADIRRRRMAGRDAADGRGRCHRPRLLGAGNRCRAATVLGVGVAAVHTRGDGERGCIDTASGGGALGPHHRAQRDTRVRLPGSPTVGDE